MNEELDGKKLGVGATASLFLGVVGFAIGILVVSIAIDLKLDALTFDDYVRAARSGGLASSMSSLAEVLAAVLGISLTVVAIVVQLAAQRYPAKIVDVFMVDPVNIGVFGFMASSCVFVAIVPVFSMQTPAPLMMTGTAIVLTVLNFGMLLPFFGHVFSFLEPTNLISEIEDRIRTALEGVARGSVGVEGAQVRVATGIDRIADNCMAAVSLSDRNLAIHSIRTMEGFAVHYLGMKKGLPEQWSRVEWDFFGTLSQEFVDEIVSQGTWVEAKNFMEFERVLRRALAEMTEVVSQVARSTRIIGVKACGQSQKQVLGLTIQFFNTYIRHGLNQRNVRAVYNILYEYRQLALEIQESHPDTAKKIVEHLVYYGRTANEMGIPFVTVTVAHDVRVICQAAHKNADLSINDILRHFLMLDQSVEGESQEVALVGVRKAQSILGAYFLQQGDDRLAELIRADMEDEDKTKLITIRDELLAVEEKKFWEITDRGLNFEYVEPEVRAHITPFYEPLLGAD